MRWAKKTMVQFPHPSSTAERQTALKILALETSGDCCSAALLIDHRLEHLCETAPRRHADLILGMLEALLQAAGLQLSDLDAIAYGRGPGSFTGVRIAAAVAQGVAFGAERPVIGISTLAAVARAAFRQTGQPQIACALDARMGEVYWACYQLTQTSAGDQALLRDQEQVIPPEQTPLLERAGLERAGWCAAGSGWRAYPELIDRHRAALQTDAKAAPTPGQRPLIIDCRPEAQDIAWLARAASDQSLRPDQALPVYLRNQVAEVSRKTPVSA